MKQSVLTQADWTQYLIHIYFGKGEPLSSCLDRAYRDFNRTLHGIGNTKNNKEIYTAGKTYLRDRIVLLKNITDDLDQDKFDGWHKNTCLGLCELYKKNQFASFHIGQAQKWINMTLKYVFTYGENKLPGYAKIYNLCHVPIDNVILTKIKKRNAPLLSENWSRIKSYDEYFKLQKWFRDYCVEQIPLDVEFELWKGEIHQ